MSVHYDSIGLRPNEKEVLEETRELLENETGHKPRQGETVKIACELLQEERDL